MERAFLIVVLLAIGTIFFMFLPTHSSSRQDLIRRSDIIALVRVDDVQHIKQVEKLDTGWGSSCTKEYIRNRASIYPIHVIKGTLAGPKVIDFGSA